MKSTKRFTWKTPSWIKVLRALLAWFKRDKVKSDSRPKAAAKSKGEKVELIKVIDCTKEVSLAECLRGKDKEKFMVEEAEKFFEIAEELLSVCKRAKRDFEAGGTKLEGNFIDKAEIKEINACYLSILINKAAELKAELLKKGE